MIQRNPQFHQPGQDMNVLGPEALSSTNPEALRSTNPEALSSTYPEALSSPYTKALGQGFNEYALVGGLVVILGVISLTALGGNVNTLFTNMIGQNRNTSNIARSVIEQTGGTTPEPLGALGRTDPLEIGNSLAEIGVSKIKITLPNGQTFQANVANAPQLMETVGPNGTTQEYLTQMNALIKALKESLPADDPLQSQLANLANEGHFVLGQQVGVLSYYEDNIRGAASAASPPQNLICGNVCSQFKDGKLRDSDVAGINVNNSHVSRFGEQAQNILKALNQRGMTGPQNLLSFYAGNIIRTSDSVGSALMNKIGTMSEVMTEQERSQVLLDTANGLKVTEYNANGICAISTHTTCYREDGQPVVSINTQNAAVK